MEPLKLNSAIINRGDLHRILRELNSLDDFLVGAKVRSPGTNVQMPKTSKLLEQLAADNQMQLFDQAQRQSLFNQLKELDLHAPSLHISFAAEPSPKTMQPIVAWLRENIHPQVMLSVGYQPKIAAGCVLRTPNKIIDMSLGAYLQKQTPMLSQLLAGSVNGN